MRKPLLFLLLTLGFTFASLTAQEALKVDQMNGNADFALSNLHKITFVEDDMILHLNDGTVLSYSITEIQRLAFGLKEANSINEHQLNTNQLSLFPNPVENELNFKLSYDSPTQLSIVNMQGEIVLQHQGKLKNKKINVAHLNSGIYLLHIVVDKQSSTKIFIKK